MIKGEQVQIIPALDFQHFEGGMDIVREIYQLPLGGFSSIKNMRPLRPGFTRRWGCVKLNTTPDGTNKAVSLYGMSKGKQAEIRFFAQMSDGDVLEATLNPPAVGTTFGSTVSTTPSLLDMLPASWAMIDDHLLYCDGAGSPKRFSGDNEDVSGFIVYKGTTAIPDVPKEGADYSLEVSDGDATTYADVSSLGTLAEHDCIFIRTETPPTALTFEISAVNGTAAVAQLHYWNGAWTAASDFVDGTQSNLTADILNDDCSSLTAWTNASTGDAVVEVSPAGQFHFDTNTSAADNRFARLSRVLISPPNQYTVEMRTKFDVLGTMANFDVFYFHYYSATTGRFRVWFASDGVNIEIDNAGSLSTLDIVKCNASADWQIFRFEVDKSAGPDNAVIDVYLDGVFQAQVNGSSTNAGTDGQIVTSLAGYATNNQETHLDYIKIATGLGAFTDSPTLGKSGVMTLSLPTDVQPKYMFGANGYWTRLSLASGALDAEVKITAVKYDSPWVTMQNVWDGVPVDAIEAYVYKAATKTYEYYAADSIEIGGLTSSDRIYFNSVDPIIGFYPSVGDVPNETAATTMTFKYWNGSAFATQTKNDSTIVDSKSLASDGWVTLVHPTDEQPTMFQSSHWFTYWYELSFDKQLTDDMTISIQTMPYLGDMRVFGKCTALSSFKQRAAYGFEKLPGYIAISGATAPAVLNGSDFALQDVGDGRANRVIAIRKFFNELLVWQEEKGKDGGCLTLIEGHSPGTFGKRVLSTQLGTFSAKSCVVVEDVPNTDPNGKTVRVTVAFFLSRYGVFMTDGKNILMISKDVQNYFDPKKSVCLRKGYEKEHWLDYDSMYQVLRIGLVSGSSAEVPNVFLVYDVQTGRWSEDILSQSFSCHAEVEAGSGQASVIQVAGGINDGTIYRTNITTKDVDEVYEASVTLEYDGQGHDLFLDEIVVRANGSCVLTPYGDTVAKKTIPIAAA